MKTKKLRRDPRAEAQAQLARYLDHLGLAEGWLVIFDLRRRSSWEKRIFHRTRTSAGKRIHVVGCS